jgi:hypothetical protein
MSVLLFVWVYVLVGSSENLEPLVEDRAVIFGIFGLCGFCLRGEKARVTTTNCHVHSN